MSKTYMGNPCKRGHSGERYKADGHCVECSRANAIKRSKTDEYKAYKAAYRAKPENKLRRAELMAIWRAKPENQLRVAKWYAAYTVRPDIKQRKAEWTRLNKYDLTPTEYNFMLAAQHFRCDLCGTDDPGNKRGWHTDHCHSTNQVRGILCHGCNSSLGKLGDTPEALHRAYLYTIGEFNWTDTQRTNSTPPTLQTAGQPKASQPIAPNAKPRTSSSVVTLLPNTAGQNRRSA